MGTTEPKVWSKRRGFEVMKKGFKITCEQCGNSLSVIHKGFYPSDKPIDLFPYSDCDGYSTTYALKFYCKNDLCRNEVKIQC